MALFKNMLNSNMSLTLPTSCEDSQVSIAMDDLGYPHCVWTDGDNIRYARFYGDGWRTAGDSAIAVSSSNLSVSRHCISFDAVGNCLFAYMDGLDLKLASWNGSTWSTETIWQNAGSGDALAWTLTWAGFPVAMVITRGYGNRVIFCTDKSSGSWIAPIGISLPAQDNDIIELKSAVVSNWVYAFWTGRNNASETSWIGHAAWSYETVEWIALPSVLVSMSVEEAEISGIDFIPTHQTEPLI